MGKVQAEQPRQGQVLANNDGRDSGKAHIPRAPIPTSDQPPTTKQRIDRIEEPDPPDFPAPAPGVRETEQATEPVVRE